LASCLKPAHRHPWRTDRARQHHPALRHCFYLDVVEKIMRKNLLFFLTQTNPRILATFGEELERNVEIVFYITQFTMGYSCRASTVCPHALLQR